jgi:O-methyltransferase
MTSVSDLPRREAPRNRLGRTGRYWLGFARLLDPAHPLASLDGLRVTRRVAPFTMITPAGLADLWRLTRRIEQRRIGGAIVQCGVWRGGSAALMAHASRASARRVWLFDSFEGFPSPGPEDGANGGIAAGDWAAPAADAREAMRRLGVDAARVSIVPGWFEATLARAAPSIGPIAILSIDTVLYASVKLCLETLYDQVVAGGVVILDDYGYWSGCRRATHEFLARRAPTAELRLTLTRAGWFTKPRSA